MTAHEILTRCFQLATSNHLHGQLDEAQSLIEQFVAEIKYDHCPYETTCGRIVCDRCEGWVDYPCKLIRAVEKYLKR